MIITTRQKKFPIKLGNNNLALLTHFSRHDTIAFLSNTSVPKVIRSLKNVCKIIIITVI